MAVSVQSFVQLVENQVAAAQGYCNTLLDFTVGSILRAVFEAVSAVDLFLQAQALQVAALTRAQSSYGADLDSFFAQFGFTRLPPGSSTGAVVFSRFTDTQQAIIPVGTVVQSFDGSQQFAVVADTANGAYSSALNGFVIPAGTASLAVAATSVTAAATANVATGTITQIVTAVPYVDTVTNAAPFIGGSDAEKDPAYRARFVLYLASLSRATRAAVLYAIMSVPGVASQTLVENQNTSGDTQYGYFYAVVDDGTGSPSSGFLSTVFSAIDAVRPLGTYFNVIAPSDISAGVVMYITTGPGYVHSTVTAQVQAAVTTYINGLGLGGALPYSRLPQVAYDTSAGVINVTGVLVNGGTSDITPTSQQRVLVSSVVVN